MSVVCRIPRQLRWDYDVKSLDTFSDQAVLICSFLPVESTCLKKPRFLLSGLPQGADAEAGYSGRASGGTPGRGHLSRRTPLPGQLAAPAV